MALYGYGYEFGVEKGKTPTKKEKEEKDIELIIGELMHARKVLTFCFGPEYKAINRELSVMSDWKVKKIIAELSFEKAQKIKEEMDSAFLSGEVMRFKELLDKRLANC